MIGFDDDGDPLEELFGGTPRPMVRPLPAAAVEAFSEPCRKCGGSGQFRSYSGRAVGPCFTCKGAGKFQRKTSPEVRARARDGAAQRKASKAATSWEEFSAGHPSEAVWITSNPKFAFAVSMREAVEKYGDLTANQLAAVQRCVAKEINRTLAKEARAAAAPTVEVNKIEAAFAVARAAAAKDREGLRWLQLRLDTFVFSDAPANGSYAAAIFIKEGVTKLGRVTGGKLHCAPDTNDATRDRILAAIADPAAAAKAYGQRTGECSVCGRVLTNADSRKLGIGPICAERFGF